MHVAGEAVDGGRVEQPAQEQHGLGPAGRGPLPRAPVVPTAVGLQPGRDAAHDEQGDRQGGTIGKHVGFGSGRGDLVETEPGPRTPHVTLDTPAPRSQACTDPPPCPW